ncbi:TraM recognition domain-containing protein [Spirosoma pollinicola]|uniref:TraD/TraG TraM recognition site domain-containing protein n=1 Tax=Spirosoma pollinicola TaxID=2057025 RepID=A0A2K8ZA13_9BACT|nr:TraM recognition domain-containing protein [Spirosoma pollinicola]AUD06716.1 hypothetical protein CWM47_35660 [Spirosoma pollinicola]
MQPNLGRFAVVLNNVPEQYILGIERLSTTGQENKIATVYAAQDLSQIEDMYGRSKKDALLANLNNQFYGRVDHRETAQYISDLWGMEDVEYRTQGQGETSRDSVQTQSQMINRSYAQRSRVRVQDELELNPGEFYGQLVESDFSSFKAQIKEREATPLPEIVPVTQVTTYDLKQNFLRIQDEVESLFKHQGPSQSGIFEPLRPKPIDPSTISLGRSNGRANNNGQVMQPGENLDF